MPKLLLRLLILTLPFWVMACSVPGVVMGTVSTAGLAALSAQGVAKSIDDAEIMLSINHKLLQYKEGAYLTISANSLAGRVMLTGTVPNAEIAQHIENIARAHPDVRNVYNYLYIGEARSKRQILRDTLIASRLKTLMLFDGEISAVNFNISIHRGVVYIQGVAAHIEQAERVVNHARNIKSVQNVQLLFETIAEMQLAFDAERELEKKEAD